MIPEYIQKIKQDRKRSTYLPGFARYYQAFILQYLVLTNRLNRIKKTEKFLWNEEIERDFIELK